MEKILEWLKANVKEGVDIAEVQALIQADSISQINTSDLATDFINRNSFFKSASDKAASKQLESFKSGKMLEMWEEKKADLLKELNPQETEVEKQLRELREANTKRENEWKAEKRKVEILKKASEIGFDPVLAEHLVLHGDNAGEVLELFNSKISTMVQSGVDERMKGFKGGALPGKKQPEEGILTKQEFDSLDGKAKMDYMRDKGQIVD